MKAKFVVGDIVYQPNYSTEKLYLILKMKKDRNTVTRTLLLFPSGTEREREIDSSWRISDYDHLGKYALEKDEFLTEVYKTKGEMNG